MKKIDAFLTKYLPGHRYTVNGKTISKPINRAIFPLLCFVAFFVICLFFIPTTNVVIKLDQLGVIIGKMFRPREGKTWSDYFAYMWSLRDSLLVTIKTSFIGTALGSLLSIPLAVLCARNVVKKAWIYQIARFIMNFIRTIPTLVLAVIAMFFFGLGPFPGVVAITIFTFGIMTKMMYEIIETIDMGPYEALESTGANKLQTVKMAVVPQVLPVFIGYFIYNFEINVRASVVLGYVGAGGIGVEMSSAIDERLYDRVGAIFIVTSIIVIILQIVTSYVRRKLQ